jgi:hypothetical protein
MMDAGEVPRPVMAAVAALKAGWLRIGEVESVKCEDVHVLGDSIVIDLHRTKTNQCGEAQSVVIPYDPATASRWHVMNFADVLTAKGGDACVWPKTIRRSVGSSIKLIVARCGGKTTLYNTHSCRRAGAWDRGCR